MHKEPERTEIDLWKNLVYFSICGIQDVVVYFKNIWSGAERQYSDASNSTDIPVVCNYIERVVWVSNNLVVLLKWSHGDVIS